MLPWLSVAEVQQLSRILNFSNITFYYISEYVMTNVYVVVSSELTEMQVLDNKLGSAYARRLSPEQNCLAVI